MEAEELAWNNLKVIRNLNQKNKKYFLIFSLI